MEFDRTGLIICSRYAYPPNRLHYCGPDKQINLSEYIKMDITDIGLSDIISQFETLFPYLQLIAKANSIKDPFDLRVVRAYWIGNSLLSKVKPKDFYRHLVEEMQIPRKLSNKNIFQMGEISLGLPYHTYHVLNIFIRTGHMALPQTIDTMDHCRISWGEIIEVLSEKIYLVKTKPLVYLGDGLKLGKTVIKKIYSVKDAYSIGDRVTFHWDYICEKVNRFYIQNLFLYTQKAITTVNSLNHFPNSQTIG
jgi:hypothetical protein